MSVEQFEYKHNGNELKIQLYRYNKRERVEFEYKGIVINNSYNSNEEEDDIWSFVGFLCQLVDVIGSGKYSIFNEYYGIYKNIKKEFIIVDSKVYKPQIDNECSYGDLILYMITMKMQDGETLDGKSQFDENETNLKYKSVCNKNELIKCLRGRVIEYYKTKNILPERKYIINEKTRKYNEITQWFKENNILELIEGRYDGNGRC